ncbi:hypothetical protein [Streptomyces sp. NPDC059009]|uniref:hypothetical protein n=1 Tax=Streptomyces sp. NPDC059009 TaxID=3346694 RepID=UPI003698F601
MTDIDFPADLIEKESLCWSEIQRGALTVETALAVHEGIAALAEASGHSRLDIEMALKRLVRHPEIEAAKS